MLEIWTRLSCAKYDAIHNNVFWWVIVYLSCQTRVISTKPSAYNSVATKIVYIYAKLHAKFHNVNG